MDSAQSSQPEMAKTARVQVAHPMLAMMGMLIGGFVGMFSETSLNIALPQLMAQLNVSTATVQWLVTGYMLMVGVVLPLSSIITKWFTTRQVILFALIDFAVGAIISASAPGFGVLLFGRMIQGIATGLILPLMFTVAMQIFPPYKLGAAMGMVGLVIMFAPAVGPTLAGIVLGVASWRWIFWLFVPFLVIAFLFAVTSLKNIAEVSRPKVDFLSIILSTLGFGSLVLGVSLASDQGWGSATVIGALIVGILILAWYTHRQLTVDKPILNLRAFAIPGFRIGAILVMINFGIILSAMYLLPMYIQKGLLVPVALTGIIMFPGGVMNAIVSAVSGRLYDHVGAQMPARLGFIISMVGALMLAFTSTHSAVWYVIMAHVILMIGAPLAMSPSQTHGLNALTGPIAADGSAIMNTLQQIVGAIATAIATSLLGIGQAAYLANGTTNAAGAFVNGAHYGFYFTFVLALVGFLLALRLPKADR
ncbi:MAG: DHA2 family efflux MFS transporter permease subunit [Levilactobacillus sp.]|jgi:DHA2 family lincomycin resistance protein-like MFS transporter|uniref:DHA2 family efflux MFS transporter permease subunit n=1 Tax=Levilactobacillus sp. TaxID=2767919 RepID=UPI00258B410A|nr:DHA2 family efflux MFS transporter permease subunit [Levilactobacillus sp.]MCI1552864.1 DHA2 family efflux MFS transporter permease subunit [Levilactobacillus sp.]MCI1598004.1 DHA2 family efflux MFS transporter permease subunit [Levilactobacillus sp.]MCI1605940.1 DHA2 family efflux MFS transporter permease subunit [Levilactobacillus sp.]